MQRSRLVAILFVGILTTPLVPALAIDGPMGPWLVGLAAPGGASGDERAPFHSDTAIGATIVFAAIGEPGFPEGIAMHDGLVFVTVSAHPDAQGEVLVYALSNGTLLERIVVPKAPGVASTLTQLLGMQIDGAGDLSRLLGLAVDGAGDLYVTDTGDARIVRIDRSVSPPLVTTYAAIPDLPMCTAPVVVSACSPTVRDLTPLPNYPAFTPNGDLYVTDMFQSTIFRIPAGKNEAQIWFQDRRLGEFGANGLALDPTGTFFYIGQSLVENVQPVGTGLVGGAVYRLPLTDAPAASDLELVHHYPAQAVDGIAFGASGKLYVTLAGQWITPHGISILGVDGEEIAFFPTAEENAQLEKPYDFPASIVFDDARRSILVTNQAITGNHQRWAVLEAFVDDTGLALVKP